MKQVILALAVIALIAFVVSGWTLGGRGIFPLKFWWQGLWEKATTPEVEYDDLNNVSFSKSFDANDIKYLDIDLVSANCKIVVEERSDISIAYSGKGEFSAGIHSSSLDIEESFKRWHIGSIRSGSLIVTIPSDLDIDIDFYSVSGQFTGGELNGDDISIETISGSIEVTDLEYDNVKLKSISGSCSVENSMFDNAEVNSVSGKLEIEALNSWEQINAESVSGSIYVFIPEESEPKVSFNSVSGKLTSDFAINNGTSGDNIIKTETVSGSVNIRMR